MAELRVQIPDELIAKLREKLGPDAKVTDIARDAITLYNWAVTERASGNVITSSDKDFKPVKQLAMPSLDHIRVSQ
ncbi:MAG: hypothetical protein ACLQBA_14175 [Candidatus Binataceae bacterium]